MSDGTPRNSVEEPVDTPTETPGTEHVVDTVEDVVDGAADPGSGHDVEPVPQRRWVALELASWAITALVGSLLLTQAVGLTRGGFVAAAQSLTPHVSLLLLPVLGVAIAQRWWTITGVAGVAACGVAVLSVPLLAPDRGPAPDADAPRTRIAVVNLLYDNDRIAEAATAIERTDPDIVVFTEYTAEHQAALLDHPLADGLTHRVERDGLLAGGTAVWSRLPLTEQPASSTPTMTNFHVDVAVETADGFAFRLWAVHPPYPFNPGWAGDLESIAERAPTIDAPLLIAGDFNASYWHPAFRAILDQGLTDAHIARGRGWSTSWPTDRSFPAFVRLDHALTNDALAPVAIDDFDVPGSDHRGFVVTVASAE